MLDSPNRELDPHLNRCPSCNIGQISPSGDTYECGYCRTEYPRYKPRYKDLTEEEQISEYLAKRVPVWINHNDETGIWYWSVQVDGTEFWLASFGTELEALRYCVDHKLPVERIHRDPRGEESSESTLR